MEGASDTKAVVWVGSSLDDIRRFPEGVRQVVGFALYEAQRGGKHVSAKPLRGFGGASVLEIVEDNDGDTYRAVYTVRFKGVIYVLHAFQKKSKHGSRTPRLEIALVESRLRQAKEHYEKWKTENE